MTRKECEHALMDLLDAAIGIYHLYNPNGKYLSMYMTDGTVGVNNRYWGAVADDPPGEDHDKPINIHFDQEEDDEVQEVS